MSQGRGSGQRLLSYTYPSAAIPTPASLGEEVISKQGTFFCSPFSKEQVVTVSEMHSQQNSSHSACKSLQRPTPLALSLSSWVEAQTFPWECYILATNYHKFCLFVCLCVGMWVCTSCLDCRSSFPCWTNPGPLWRIDAQGKGRKLLCY